jgi:D-alanyl-lipoteichoic acid acyltransferase DltB (MBOAT superfamily)
VFFPSLLNWVGFALLAIVYWLLPSRLRPGWLGLGSILLLAYNDYLAGLFVLYLIAAAALGGRLLPPAGSTQGRHRALWFLLAACAAPLILLKYQVLLGIDAMQRAGLITLNFGALAVPLGISYLTFKCLMYLLQVARGVITPVRFDVLAAYLAFAPAATSGPIDRPDSLLPQITTTTRLDLDRIIYAGYRITMGVFFKFVLADTLSESLSDLTPAMIAVSPVKQAIFGPYYSLWLYFDFAGYSHIAIGAAYLLGIKSMENFAAPLLRQNISEFWRTWHISLTSMLRNYIFLPAAYRWSRALGPQRAAYAATVLTFLICGIWHGDGMNYIVWGLYHGVLLAVHQAFVYGTRKAPLFKRLRRQRWLVAPSWALTFALVSLGWYPFAFTMPQLFDIFYKGVGR